MKDLFKDVLPTKSIERGKTAASIRILDCDHRMIGRGALYHCAATAVKQSPCLSTSYLFGNFGVSFGALLFKPGSLLQEVCELLDGHNAALHVGHQHPEPFILLALKFKY